MFSCLRFSRVQSNQSKEQKCMDIRLQAELCYCCLCSASCLIFRLCNTQPTIKTFVFTYIYSLLATEKILIAFLFLSQFARHKLLLKITDILASKQVIR